ncbi:MAG: acyl-CoA dehydrogenase family protein [Thermoanaerobaculia bacterium]|nr:acyl-CoA dehydrogenase family protein [Thermoanaerobaculia bacterium]
MIDPTHPAPPDLDTVRAFLDHSHGEVAIEAAEIATEIEQLAVVHDDEGARSQAREILSILGSARLPRHAAPNSWGGVESGPQFRSCCLVREALAAVSPLADSVFALQCLGSMPVTLGGTDELRQRVLPKVIGGEWMAAFAMTEPDAGSDVASMRTRARRDGAEWVLEGHKHLITNAGEADFYCVFAVTDPDAGSRGISCFFVEHGTPGLHFAGAQILSEPHPLGALEFDGCRVPAGCMLGAEGEGFKLGMRTLDRLRPTVAAAACGMATRALDEALAHATTRRQFGRPLAELQMTQQKLARMATELTAARLLTYRAAWAADQGKDRISQEAAMAKSYASEAAQRIVDDAVQVCGGRACLRDHPVDRLYRAVRALRIYEGATEVQHLVIARGLVDSYGRQSR